MTRLPIDQALEWHNNRPLIDALFNHLERKLKTAKLRDEWNTPRRTPVPADEFMLMQFHEAEKGSYAWEAGFKHRYSRNYVYLRKSPIETSNAVELIVPRTDKAFHRGRF